MILQYEHQNIIVTTPKLQIQEDGYNSTLLSIRRIRYMFDISASIKYICQTNQEVKPSHIRCLCSTDMDTTLTLWHANFKKTGGHDTLRMC